MKTWVVVGIVLLGVIAALLSRPETPTAAPYEALLGQPAISPSGKYRLIVVEGHNGYYRSQQFEIVSNVLPARVLYRCSDHFRSRDTTYFLWDLEDRVWVYSGDVGTSYWTRARDGQWEKRSYSDGGVEAPALLKQRRPNVFGP